MPFTAFYVSPPRAKMFLAVFRRNLQFLSFAENAGADVDAETQTPNQPAGGSGGQHGARLDGA